MTSQQAANIMLAEWREAKLKLAIVRSEQLLEFYQAERRAGVDHMLAHERMAEHAKFLDELELVNAEMERTS